jgi:hypothetical protein
MAETPQKTLGEQVAALSEDLLESVESGSKAATEAVRKYMSAIQEAAPGPTVEQPFDQSQYKTVIDAAMDMTDTLVTTYMQFLRSIAESASQTVGKKE